MKTKGTAAARRRSFEHSTILGGGHTKLSDWERDRDPGPSGVQHHGGRDTKGAKKRICMKIDRKKKSPHNFAMLTASSNVIEWYRIAGLQPQADNNYYAHSVRKVTQSEASARLFSSSLW